jgi:hypothetical protein
LCQLDVDATSFLDNYTSNRTWTIELQYAAVAVALFLFEANCEAVANCCSPLLLVKTTIKLNLCFQ